MSHWDLDTTRTRPDVTKTHPNAVIGPIPAELGMVISLCSGCARSFVEREKRCESDNNVVFLRYTATERGPCEWIRSSGDALSVADPVRPPPTFLLRQLRSHNLRPLRTDHHFRMVILAHLDTPTLSLQPPLTVGQL